MKKINLKKLWIVLAPIIAIPAITTPIVLSAQHTSNTITNSPSSVANFYKTLHNDGATSWDALMSLETQLEQQQTANYAAANPTWTPAQIAAQVSLDDADFYNIWYRPTSSDDSDKDACYNYLMQYSNSIGISLISWEYIEASEDTIIDQITSSNPKINRDDIKNTFDSLISQGIANNTNPATFYNDAVAQILAASTDKNAQKAYLSLMASKFMAGNFAAGSDENMADPAVESYIESGTTDFHLTPLTFDVLDANVESKFFTYTSNDQINPTVSGIDDIPFLKDAGISIFQTRAYPIKKSVLDYRTILTDGNTSTNTMQLEFILEDSHGNKLTTDKMDYKFAYTDAQCDYIISRFKNDYLPGGFGGREMVNTKYNNLMYDKKTNQYVPFNASDLSQKDTWYATYGNAANFNYAVGDELPDEITSHICQVTGNGLFVGVDDGCPLNDVSVSNADYMTNNSLPAGRIVAKVSVINISIDNPYVDLDMYWKTNSGKEYLLQYDQILSIYGSGPEKCDHNRFSLYWDKDTLADLNLASTIAYCPVVNDGVQMVQKFSKTETINDINNYSAWTYGYASVEATLSAAYATISAAELISAAFCYASMNIAEGVILTAMGASDAANSVIAAITSYHSYKDAIESQNDVEAILKIKDLADNTSLLSDMANLQDDINRFNNPTTFAGFVQSAEAIITDAQNFDNSSYSDKFIATVNEIGRLSGAKSDIIDKSLYTDLTCKWMIITLATTTFAAFSSFALIMAVNGLLKNLVQDGGETALAIATRECDDACMHCINMMGDLWADGDDFQQSIIIAAGKTADQVRAEAVAKVRNLKSWISRAETLDSFSINDLSVASIIVSVVQAGVAIGWHYLQQSLSDRVLADLKLI